MDIGIEEVKHDLKLAAGNISEQYFTSSPDDQATGFGRLYVLHCRLARVIEERDEINAWLEREWLDVSNLKELPEEDWREDKVEYVLEKIELIRIGTSTYM